MALNFEWDAVKAAANIRKHGVSFEEASAVFSDPLSLTIEDGGNTGKEVRYITLGLSLRHRLLAVVHADRGEAIRMISARRATRKERRDYENA